MKKLLFALFTLILALPSVSKLDRRSRLLNNSKI